MVSADGGMTWEVRSTVDLFDFAVSPTNPERLLAATAQGLHDSSDGGRTWQPISGAPPVTVLSWAGAAS